MRSRQLRAVLFGPAMLLAGAGVALADNDPNARFRGAPSYDLAVTNVRWEAATNEYSHVTFDLSWSFSWRAAWTEPARSSVTGRDLRLENWDAAWVFVKYLPEKDSKESIERNHWRHATLSTDAADHVMPAEATNTVGLTDDGTRGLGVFVYRDAVGQGRNDFRVLRLRWQHGADRVNPARAAVRVHALAMVYVPQGAFKVGSGIAVPIDRFPDGPTRPIVGGPLPGKDPDWPRGCFASFTDGAWRGGEPTIPFLVDAEWSGPVAADSRARRIGPRPGMLWGNMVFDYHNRGLTHGWGSMEPVADGYPPATLHNDFPTGYGAFYCMKYYLTQGQYAAFLNSLPPDVAAERAFVSGDGRPPHKDNSAEGWGLESVEKREVQVGAGYRPHIIEEWDGHTITCSGDPIPKVPADPVSGAGKGLNLEPEPASDPLVESLVKDVMADRKGKDKPKGVPVYTARVPQRACNFLGWADGLAYAVWAGLRPMTELEFEKAARGPGHPVPTETVLGSGDPRAPTERARQAAAATYWGIRYDHAAGHGGYNMGGEQVVTVATTLARSFHGSHGDGATSAGTPGASLRRTGIRYDPAGFTAAPADWPKGVEGGKYGVGPRGRLLSSREYAVGIPPQRLGEMCWRGVRSAPGEAALTRAQPSPARPSTPAPTAEREADAAARGDAIRITNVKWEAGTKDSSLVTFDLAWEGSWRAAWTEPADRNVTGKPLAVESWDAAWVFVKFRRPGVAGSSHATLAADLGAHRVPPGAELDVGLDDDGARALGVFVYRDVAGSGPVAWPSIRLRWLHGTDQAEPGRVELAVHAIGMVYVADGPFRSRGLLRQPIDPATKTVVTPRHPLTLIATEDATRPGGYYGSAGADVPEHPTWPNGYRAFYCMKWPITQGQYATFLNSMRGVDYNARMYRLMPGETSRPNHEKLHPGRFYGLCGYTIQAGAAGTYRADAPDRPCNFLSWPDIQSYAAWAALRPPTALEYEKACRGPRDFARPQDAWAEGACAPAAALPAPARRGASYWGIHGLSVSGCVHEWPGTIGNGIKRVALNYKGTHGHGAAESPPDWPESTAFGEWFYMSWEAGGGTIGFSRIGIWIDPLDMQRVRHVWMSIDADRTGRYGARAVRTALPRGDRNSPLQLDPLPNLRRLDVAVFHLSGRFRNDTDKPLEVELAPALPDACFPQGPASRTFTAAAKAVTPLRVLTALTSSAAAGAVRSDGTLPVRLRTAGGEVLAERLVRLVLCDPAEAKPPTVGSLDGGEVTLRISNATDRPQAVTVEMPSPLGLRLPQTVRQTAVSAGGEARVSFPIGPQPFAKEGVCRIPYRVAVADGPLQDGQTAADLRVQSRWWVTRRIRTGPKSGLDGSDDAPGVSALLTDAASGLKEVFGSAVPPKGWKRQTYGSYLPVGSIGPLPSRGSAAVAVTRLAGGDEREAVVAIDTKWLWKGRGGPPAIDVLVWVNDALVFDSTAEEKDRARSFRLRKAGNTLAVECRSASHAAITPGNVRLEFLDARDRGPLTGLVLDMDER